MTHSRACQNSRDARARRRRGTLLRCLLTGCLTAPVAAVTAETVIPLDPHGDLATYYLSVEVASGVVDDYLVDTGAGFMTITEETLSRLQERGQAHLLREIEGRLADGRVLRVPVYRLDEIVIGGTCVLHDVEAAVLPGASRGLLGLSALRRTSPFAFSVDPPSLTLSNCFPPALLTASATPAG